MQRINVMRIGRENGVIDSIGVVEPPGPVQRQRPLERVGELR